MFWTIVLAFIVAYFIIKLIKFFVGPAWKRMIAEATLRKGLKIAEEGEKRRAKIKNH